jgi:hypothetical protein
MTCPICDQKPMNCDCTPNERRMHAEIEDLEEQVPRWISVTERMPEPDTFAIVATKHGVCEALYGLAGIESPNDPPYWVVANYGEVWPTHWMPLPAPPSDDK